MSRRLYVALATATLFVTASAQSVLHDNGPFITHPGAGPGGADHSTLQEAALGLTIYGHSASVANGSRVADDFEVTAPGGWQLSTIEVYGYQTGSGTTSTITAVNVRIWDGPPGEDGSDVLYGDDVTDALVTTAWTDSYRVSDVAANPDRPIMVNEVDASPIFLPAGTFWLDWQLAGSLGSGPWVPAVTVLGSDFEGNALGFSPGTSSWVPAIDNGTTTQQALPFVLHGDPAALALAGRSLPAQSTSKGRQDLRVAAFDASSNVAVDAGLVDVQVAVMREDGTTPYPNSPVGGVALYLDADGDSVADDLASPLGQAQVGADGTATITLTGANVPPATTGGFVVLVDLKSAAAAAPSSVWFGVAALLPSAFIARFGRRRLASWLAIGAVAFALSACGGGVGAPTSMRVSVTGATAAVTGGTLDGAPVGVELSAATGPIITVQ